MDRGRTEPVLPGRGLSGSSRGPGPGASGRGPSENGAAGTSAAPPHAPGQTDSFSTAPVVALGGGPWNNPFASASRYAPGAANNWTQLPNMTTPRQSLAAATLHGTVFALGGLKVSSNTYLASVEAFDLAAGAHWTLLAASMTTPRSGHAAAVLRGLIYAAGGQGPAPNYNALASVERFDGGAHSTWALVASMGTARYYFALVALEEGGPSHHGGMLVAAGGCNANSCASAEAYDPVADQWAAIADMATARYGCAGAALLGKAYVSGGYDGSKYLSSVEVFDPATNTWDLSKANVTTGRYKCALAVLNGELHAAGRARAARRRVHVPEGQRPVLRAQAVQEPWRRRHQGVERRRQGRARQGRAGQGRAGRR